MGTTLTGRLYYPGEDDLHAAARLLVLDHDHDDGHGAAWIEVKKKLLRAVGDFSGQFGENLTATQFFGRLLIAGVDGFYRHRRLLILPIKHDNKILPGELTRRILGRNLIVESLLFAGYDLHRRIKDVGLFLCI